MKAILVGALLAFCQGCTTCARDDVTLSCDVRGLDGKCLYVGRNGDMLAGKKVQ